jgi:inosose dehydratase
MTIRIGANPALLARKSRNRTSHVHTKGMRPEVRAQSAAGDWSFLDSVIGGVYAAPTRT